jgi:hypothetical protein
VTTFATEGVEVLGVPVVWEKAVIVRRIRNVVGVNLFACIVFVIVSLLPEVVFLIR